MTSDLLEAVKEELASGYSGVVRNYFDTRIELLTGSKESDDKLTQFADKLLRFTWTARKVADLNEKLALECFEDGMAMTEWVMLDVKSHLDKM